MADPSDQAPSTDVSGDGSDIPLGAKIGYAIVAVIGLLGLAGCLGEFLLLDDGISNGRQCQCQC